MVVKRYLIKLPDHLKAIFGMLLLGYALFSYYGFNYSLSELFKGKYGLSSMVLMQTRTREQSLSNQFVKIQEVRHLGFLKVPKTGSSTMTNIFYRFGLKRNLTYVLPASGINISNDNILPAPDGVSFDMLCNHARFNKEMFTTILPEDTAYIAIVRDPLSLFVSSANYNTGVFHVPYLMKVPKKDFLLTLIRYPTKYDRNNFSSTKNSMAMYFGFQDAHVNHPELVQAYLGELGKFFTFVLIMEHMDESLILMKRKLNWTFADIMYEPKNVRSHTFTIDARTAEVNGFRDRNWLDYRVYEFFYSIFLAEMAKQQESIETEVAAFRKVLYKVQRFCHSYTNISTEELIIPESQYNPMFNVTVNDCKYMALDVKPILKIMRDKRIKQLGQKSHLRGRVVDHNMEWIDVDNLNHSRRKQPQGNG